MVESSDEDLDNDENSRQAQDISNIWADDEDLSEDDFIDDSDESATGMNEEARAARREERRQENLRRKRARVRPELVGIDAKWVIFCMITILITCRLHYLYSSAWDEIHEVFGDGHEYDWALVGDDEVEYEEEVKPDMRYQDVRVFLCIAKSSFSHVLSHLRSLNPQKSGDASLQRMMISFVFKTFQNVCS